MLLRALKILSSPDLSQSCRRIDFYDACAGETSHKAPLGRICRLTGMNRALSKPAAMADLAPVIIALTLNSKRSKNFGKQQNKQRNFSERSFIHP